MWSEQLERITFGSDLPLGAEGASEYSVFLALQHVCLGKVFQTYLVVSYKLPSWGRAALMPRSSDSS